MLARLTLILRGVALALLWNFAHGVDVPALQAGVVKVIAVVDGVRKTGAGFIVRTQSDRCIIATAAHVVEGAEQVEVEFFADRNHFVPTRVLAVEGADPTGAAALLVQGAPPAGARQLRLAPDLPTRPGDPVLTIGFPRAAAPYSVIKGEIAGRRGRLLDISAALDEGNSGGPLLVDDAVVGMVLEVRSPFAHALPAIILRYVLESWAIDTGAQVALRSQPGALTPQAIAKALQRHGLSHPGARMAGLPRGLAGRYEPHYETRELEGDKIVIDHASGLIWEQSGSKEALTADNASDHVEQLNARGYAGSTDWRVPTIEELASLLRPQENSAGLYASPLFDDSKFKLWSADTHAVGDASHQWGVDLGQGYISDDASGIAAEVWRWVRAVRSKP